MNIVASDKKLEGGENCLHFLLRLLRCRRRGRGGLRFLGGRMPAADVASKIEVGGVVLLTDGAHMRPLWLGGFLVEEGGK